MITCKLEVRKAKVVSAWAKSEPVRVHIWVHLFLLALFMTLSCILIYGQITFLVVVFASAQIKNWRG